MDSRTAVLIFAKFPAPGRVKTRMTPPLTEAEAAALHATSLAAVCARARAIAAGCTNCELKVELCVSPDSEVGVLGAQLGFAAEHAHPQGTGQLGERLIRATSAAVRRGADRVVLLGADSPTLPADALARAIAPEDPQSCCVGPCDDGGYYLLSTPGLCEPLLRDVDWGTRSVLAQTHAKAAAHGIDLRNLPAWYDLDEFSDLQRSFVDIKKLTQAAGPVGESNRTDDLQAAATAAMNELYQLVIQFFQRYTG